MSDNVSIKDISAAIQKTWPGWKPERLIRREPDYSDFIAEKKRFLHKTTAIIRYYAIDFCDACWESIIAHPDSQSSGRLTPESIIQTLGARLEQIKAISKHENLLSIQDYSFIGLTNHLWILLIRTEMLPRLESWNLTETKAVWRDPQRVIAIGKDICSAGTVCSRENIIPESIHPANVYVGPDGQFKLGCFSMENCIEQHTGKYLYPLGALTYADPEIYHRPNACIGPCLCGVYSLGILMYMLANDFRLPFYTDHIRSSNIDALSRRYRGESFPPPCNAGQRLGEIILRASAFNSDQRFSSFEEMKGALLRI